jgi:hypothetical protein
VAEMDGGSLGRDGLQDATEVVVEMGSTVVQDRRCHQRTKEMGGRMKEFDILILWGMRAYHSPDMGVCGLGVREDNQGDDEMTALIAAFCGWAEHKIGEKA